MSEDKHKRLSKREVTFYDCEKIFSEWSNLKRHYELKHPKYPVRAKGQSLLNFSAKKQKTTNSENTKTEENVQSEEPLSKDILKPDEGNLVMTPTFVDASGNDLMQNMYRIMSEINE